MIRLDLARAPRTLDLGHGVTVTVLPFTSAMMMAARDRLTRIRVATGAEIGAIDLVQEIGRLAITSWEGVEGEDGAPAPVTEACVTALLDIWHFAEAFQMQYVGPALTLADEKNALSPSPNGTSAGATATAQPVPSAAPSARIQ